MSATSLFLNDALETVIAIVRKNAAGGPQTPIDINTDLFEQGIVDSLGIMGIMLDLEERLGCRLAPEQLIPENFRTVNQIFQFLKLSKV